eukprot:TRINITY_DN61329_c0_g1_i1.p2 TRINITY_DN61329_c0_g1~~TRINITY_DN61329_c0_g1_i1.p2  ORF type:complete len:266 (-),score=75.86 TRINITY_DN61329_c0_g1_i1:73-870(-)
MSSDEVADPAQELERLKELLIEKDTERHGAGWDEARKHLQALSTAQQQLFDAQNTISELERSSIQRNADFSLLEHQLESQAEELKMLRPYAPKDKDANDASALAESGGKSKNSRGQGQGGRDRENTRGEPNPTPYNEDAAAVRLQLPVPHRQILEELEVPQTERAECAVERHALAKELASARQAIELNKSDRAQLEFTLDSTRAQLDREDRRRKDAEAEVSVLRVQLAELEQQTMAVQKEARGVRFTAAGATEQEGGGRLSLIHI